jgi:hypothetical protein
MKFKIIKFCKFSMRWDPCSSSCLLMSMTKVSILHYIKFCISVKILRKIEKEKNFSTIEKMMKEEKSAGKINYKRLDVDHPSGSRTLLVLHRAFKMISTLLGKLSRNEHDGKMSIIAYESYHSSPMAAHHPWVSQIHL